MITKTANRGTSMLTTLRVEQSDFEKLQGIAQRFEKPLEEVFHEIMEHFEQDDEFDQMIDDALRSPQVKDAFAQLNDSCKRAGL